jgi:RNA polymerase sigma-70 factor (ECF subfamily)
MPGTDHALFQRSIVPHLDALYRAAYRLTRHRADAEDLVQETCIRACERIESLRESRNMKAWLLRVQHNLFVDGKRSDRRCPIDAPAGATDHAAASASTDPTPEESLASAQRARQIERAWLRLDRGHRALLALRAEGYSLAEMSEITNIAIDALSMRLYRARQSLTLRLKEEQAPASRTPLEIAR